MGTTHPRRGTECKAHLYSAGGQPQLAESSSGSVGGEQGPIQVEEERRRSWQLLCATRHACCRVLAKCGPSLHNEGQQQVQACHRGGGSIGGKRPPWRSSRTINRNTARGLFLCCF